MTESEALKLIMDGKPCEDHIIDALMYSMGLVDPYDDPEEFSIDDDHNPVEWDDVGWRIEQDNLIQYAITRYVNYGERNQTYDLNYFKRLIIKLAQEKNNAKA